MCCCRGGQETNSKSTNVIKKITNAAIIGVFLVGEVVRKNPRSTDVIKN